MSEALGLIWAARRGLTETDLLRLLKPANLPQLPLAVWTPLRSALEEGLVDRGGILNFAHDFLRTAVGTAFVPDEDKRDELRLQLADDFERQPISMRSCDELPWLLEQTESFERLRACLLNIHRFVFIRSRDQEELRRYWVRLGEEQIMGRPYIDSFESWSRTWAGGDARIADAARDLAFFLHDAALNPEAEPLCRHALAMTKESLGPEHPEVARDLSLLAVLLESTNRLAEAEPLIRRALAIDEKSLGPEHPNIASHLNILVVILMAANRMAEAEPLAHRALAIDEKRLGPEHPKVAIDLNNLAGVLLGANRLAEAEPLYRRALAIDEKSLGPEHSDFANHLNNFATLLQATNRLAEAEPLFRRALAIDERRLGPWHPDVGRDLNNLGTLLQAMNRLAEAEQTMRRGLEIEEKSRGKDNPFVAIHLLNLTQLLQATNRVAEAEPLARRTVEIFFKFTRATGHPHPHLQVAIRSYAGLLSQMGRSQAEILAQLSAIGKPFGVQFGPGA